MITLLDSDYPTNLRNSVDPPAGLFISGKILKKDSKAVAIVGSRQASEYGKRIAKGFADVLSRNSITIVSGLARGIDTIAHETALENKGRTIAVLGSGIDVIYPPENQALADKISKKGALITEFPSGTKPLPKNFLRRNRIIAGLSLAVIVIEGRKRSGTLVTARYAAELGREVFAVPGMVDSPLSEAPHYLIEQGARVAKSPEDVLEHLSEIEIL